MRAYNGQLSDNQPIRRNTTEKQKQLRELKETLASMKPQTSPALRQSVQRRIRELETELRTAERQSAARAAERQNMPSRAGDSSAPRRPRRPQS
ncbi:hypothetical protein AA101099_3035 [Neoasaia chiangmaiensis NBRC 101099]|uniref:Uncharacterized protein n=1 Tax=Neoasaia chiangmaiensis TaxID=320497 RepID=A0A1U9KU33_9PROT|nr:hypothetical protein [Neoasaia chiangmaiensis]AQS89295.1 hypothetical protein A0U93_04865 [Neoasaia chiangmaiensis]GBR42928.1 hypothetical protein AA101099_3035 [Neoasaia chiangmaiensis NBRC 101099]GEN16143.1 hypothetical protein NCH01_25740 [Neoasaia chiangmaiensis]